MAAFKKKDIKDVYIVGTGISGSLIAKTLTDYVLKKGEIINRTAANIEFKEILRSIEYFEEPAPKVIKIKNIINQNGTGINVLTPINLA